MAKKAAQNIYLSDAEHGSVVFEAGDEVPAWAEKLITAKGVYEGDEPDEPDPDKAQAAQQPTPDKPDKPERK